MLRTSRYGPACVSLLWGTAVVAGFCWLADYANRPGSEGAQPTDWPADSRLTRDAARFTLIVAVHPECPCSAATAGELSLLMDRCGGLLDVQVLVVGSRTPTDWPIWLKSGVPSAATLIDDPDSIEAARFGAMTSGHAVLFDASGHRRFHGGITAARGHAGDNPGRRSIETIVRGGASAADQFPVFGCRLQPTTPETAP